METKFLDGMNSRQALVFGLLVSWSALATLGLVIIGWHHLPGKSAGSFSYTDAIDPNTPANPRAPAANPGAPNPPSPAALKPVTGADHIRGGKNAKVTLIEFSDFECPFCSRVKPTLDKILSTYGSKVRLVYRHFPLSSIHPQATAAAEASECAGEQGKFWEYHDILFQNQQALDANSLKQYAGRLGLNQGAFGQCLDSGKYRAKVAEQTKEGESAGVNGTPATFINGQLVSGAVPYESFAQIIDAQLK